MSFSGSNKNKYYALCILLISPSNLRNGAAHVDHSKPFSSTQIHFLALLQVTHDIINTPRLKLVPSRIVRRDALIILHPDSFLDVFGALLVIIMRMPFGVMFPDPLRQARRRLARINLDLSPVGFLQQLSVGEPYFLGAGGACESVEVIGQFCIDGPSIVVVASLPQCLVHIDSLFDVILASDL